MGIQASLNSGQTGKTMRRVSLAMWLVVCRFFLLGGNPLAAQMFIDLSPAGVSPSSAEAIDAGQAVRTGQLVGSGLTAGRYHAFFWKSFRATSAVDLNPFGYLDSYATAVSGNIQVGYGTSSTDNRSHALFWRGSAATAAECASAP